MVSILTILVIAAATITTAFGLLCLIALGTSIRLSRATRKKKRTRERVRTELFDRLTRGEPNWNEWVAGLSRTEQTELAGVVERYLRTVSGSERESYLAVAEELQMGERADATLDTRPVIPRLRALARLSVLSYPISEQRLLDTSLDDHRTREAAARVLAERRDEFDNPRPLGTALLIWDGRTPMTARGLKTLFDLNEEQPLTLLSQGMWGAENWHPTVLIQVCTVLEACQTPVRASYFDWLVRLFEHDDPAVRAAAVRAFGGVGWREDLRERIPYRQLVTDDDPRVRRATYRTLSRWGDQRATDLLEWAVIDEDDERAQLLAVKALATLEGEPDETQPGWPDAAWNWVRAERRVTMKDQRVEGKSLPTAGVMA